MYGCNFYLENRNRKEGLGKKGRPCMKHFSKDPYNQRQLVRMHHEITIFMRGDSNLSMLVKQLKALFWALNSPDQDWSEDFLSYWGSLETANALRLDHAEQGLVPIKDDSGGELEVECVKKLHELVDAEME